MKRKACIVTGDRDADDDRWRHVIEKALDHYAANDYLVVIHGAARGIDSIAHAIVSDSMRMVPMAIPAKWDEYGRGAGPIRNKAMLRLLQSLTSHDYAIAVFAFHDDLTNSKGTKNMVNLAIDARLDVYHWTSDAIFGRILQRIP